MRYLFFSVSFFLICSGWSRSEEQQTGRIENVVPFKKGIAKIIGGGSTNNAVYTDPASINIYEAANIVGMGAARGNLNHHEYWRDGKPVTDKLERIIGWYRYGLQPKLLFNHYPNSDEEIGGYQKWYNIGRAFAEKYRPNSDFLLSYGIKDWGITDYMAFNEPVWHVIRHPGTMSPESYAEALKGLADGVHSIDSKLNVSPGGYTFPLWQTVLSEHPKLEELALIKAVVPLFNDGTLHCFYLHPYVNRRDFQKSRSAQQIFTQAKEVLGITRDIPFGVVEFCFAGSYIIDDKKDSGRGIDKNANIAEHFGEETEEEKAFGFMAAMWDNLSVTGDMGQPITHCVLAWEPLTTYLGNPNWGLAIQKAPYEGRLAANTIQMNSWLTEGMSFTSIDHEEEVFVLEGNENRLIVWQNWEGWSSIASDTFKIRDIPIGTERIDVFDALSWKSYAGSSGTPSPLQQIEIVDQDEIEVRNLKNDRTYLFMLWKNPSTRNLPIVKLGQISESQEGDESIIIRGKVSSSDGNISVTRFYNGANLLEEYSGGGDMLFKWKNPPAGINNIRITAMDDRGWFNTSQSELAIMHNEESRINVSEDTYIRGFHKRYSGQNFGNLRVIEVKTGGRKAIRYAYLKFDTTSIPDDFESCYLRLKVERNSDQTNSVCQLYEINDDLWKEQQITWEVAPGKGRLIATASVPAPGEWIEFDVTDHIKALPQDDKKVSFRLEKPNRTYLSFHSRESHELNAPFLVFK